LLYAGVTREFNQGRASSLIEEAFIAFGNSFQFIRERTGRAFGQIWLLGVASFADHT
jgi:hypothetical protein